ncbi:MAG TPA: hemerythrin domain-containing protein [Mycobacteriales bacterium]|nr:hemerythrin domain-containing protein [Mycobacteriales bacterium]
MTDSPASPPRPALDEATRPRAPRQPGTISTAGRYRQRALVAIHDHLRHDLAQIVRAVEAAAAGELDPGTARTLVNDSTINQNYQLTGAFCAQYCQIVTMHHRIESQRLFPEMADLEPSLEPVLTRLHEEHEVVHDILVTLDGLLVRMVNESSGATEVAEEARRLRTALLSHLGYEEEELLDPLGRLPIQL